MGPHEQHGSAVASAADAKAKLAEWKQHMPAVPSAYQPSGKVPAPAFGLLTLGALAGSLAGPLAGAASLAGGLLLAWGIMWLSDLLLRTVGTTHSAMYAFAFAAGVLGFA